MLSLILAVAASLSAPALGVEEALVGSLPATVHTDAELEGGVLFDVAIGRRPYIAETEGNILFQASQSILGQVLHIKAVLPCANASWNWTLATNASTAQYILALSGLDALPKMINNDMIINVTLGSGGREISVRRRFIRAFKQNATNTVQVDHSARGLLVDGTQWAGFGWYIYPLWPIRTAQCTSKPPPARGSQLYQDCIRWGIGNMTNDMAKMADRGVNMIMPYNFDPFEKHGVGGLPLDEIKQLIWNYFDTAAEHGLKVLFHMATMWLDRGDYTNATLQQIHDAVALVKDHPALLAYYICDDCFPHADLTAVFNTLRQLDPFHLTIGAGFGGNKNQYSDSFNNHFGHAMDNLEMLPSILCTPEQGAGKPIPCNPRFPKGAQCTPCGSLSKILPVTALSLDVVMIENYDPDPDTHAVNDYGLLRSGMPWAPMVNSDASYTLEEHISPHKPPNILQTNMWMSLITAGTVSQLIFAGAAPVPAKFWPWGQKGSHPEASMWGSKSSMQLYDQIEAYAAQVRVILPSLYAPFGLAQPTVSVLKSEILLPSSHVAGWPIGKTIVARAWRQAAPAGYCGHLIVASGVQQSTASFTLQLGGSFPRNLSWASMRAVRLFDADYTVPIDALGRMTDYIAPAGHNIYQIGDCGDRKPKPPPPVCSPDVTLGCFDVSDFQKNGTCDNLTATKGRHDVNKGCLMLSKSSQRDFHRKLTQGACAQDCHTWETRYHRETLHHYNISGVMPNFCFCGDPASMSLPIVAKYARPLAECAATPCNHDQKQHCGAPHRLLVYNYTCVVPPGPWDPHDTSQHFPQLNGVQQDGDSLYV